MRRRSGGRQAFVSLLFILSVVTLTIWVGNFASQTAVGDNLFSSPTPNPTDDLPKVIGSTSPDVSPVLTDYNLLIGVKSGSATQLVVFNPDTKTRQVVYTDQDEPLKIKQIGNVSQGEALVLLAEKGQDFGGSLWAVQLDGSGTATRLLSEFASPWPPIFSPDGQKIVFVSFSASEVGAAFSLILANRDGSNQRVLTQDRLPLTGPIFSSDGKSIAYIRENSGSQSGEIVMLPVAGGTPKTLVSLPNQVPYDLAWSASGSLAYIDGVGQSGDLFELESGTIEPKRLSNLSGQESHPVYRPDGQALAFTRNLSAKTTLYLLDQVKGSAEAFGSATIVVGWLERTGFDE
jgi:hypothetical protein